MKTIDTVLFDLDGTLLPMDQDVFVKAYFGLLARRFPQYDAKQLIAAVWKGTDAMVQNDGSATNEAVFWDAFAAIFGDEVRKEIPRFEEYYRTDFQKVAEVCGHTPEAARTVALCKELGLQTALATNPIFPAIATESRIRWAGMEPEDFSLHTTYEFSHYCKPNPDYYREIVEQLDLDPARTLMVGNDVDEDMVAEGLGMKTFLLTDCLINKHEKDITAYPHGDFAALQAHIRSLAE